jgi:hypothetical protein
MLDGCQDTKAYRYMGHPSASSLSLYRSRARASGPLFLTAFDGCQPSGNECRSTGMIVTRAALLSAQKCLAKHECRACPNYLVKAFACRTVSRDRDDFSRLHSMTAGTAEMAADVLLPASSAPGWQLAGRDFTVGLHSFLRDELSRRLRPGLPTFALPSTGPRDLALQ